MFSFGWTAKQIQESSPSSGAELENVLSVSYRTLAHLPCTRDARIGMRKGSFYAAVPTLTHRSE